MLIETKLNINDACFYLKSNKVVESIVKAIEIKVSNFPLSTKYHTSLSDTVLDVDIHKTKQDLLDSL